jgi:hypothetical protein
MSILDHFRPLEEFEPESTAQYLALQLARQMRDLPNLPAYLHWSETFSFDELARAFYKARKTASHPGSVPEHFRRHLHS